MSFNGSFQDAQFVNDEESNNISFGEEDIKINLTGGTGNKKNSEIKCFINNELSIPTNSNNNIFSSVPMELEIDNNYQNLESNNCLEDLLSKELVKYNLGNIFNIINNKLAIIKTNVFYQLKNMYINKLNSLLKAQILFLRINSSLDLINSIFSKQRINRLYIAFYKIKRKYIYYIDTNENDKDNFRAKFELNYQKEKNNVINQNNNDIKLLQKDIQTLKKNINQLTMKETELKTDIYNCLQEEKRINAKIKDIESLNNSIKKSIQTSNSSSIKTISKYDNDILSLESAIKLNKNMKEEKQRLINKFMQNVNSLLNEYQEYINNLKNINTSRTGTNNNMNIELTSTSNLQSIKHKETIENSLFGSKFSV